MELSTERLFLRRFEPEDWQDLYEYLSNPEVVKFEPYDAQTEEECRKAAEERAKSKDFWAVCLNESGKLIGNIYFAKQQPDEFETYEIGYVFNPAFGGKGYATEAAGGVLDYAFNKLGAHRIMAMCNPKNPASWKLLERVKMRREAHFIRNAFFRRDESCNPLWFDTYQYAILKEEYYGV